MLTSDWQGCLNLLLMVELRTIQLMLATLTALSCDILCMFALKSDMRNIVLQQYWDSKRGSYSYVSVAAFAEAFQQTEIAKRNMAALEEPYVAPNAKCDEALITHKYALPCRLLCLVL